MSSSAEFSRRPFSIDPEPSQEALEVLASLSEAVVKLARRAARGSDDAAETIRMIRDEAHGLLADAKDEIRNGATDNVR